MSKTTRFILIFSILLLMLGTLTGIFTINACGDGNGDDGGETSGYNVNYYVDANVADGESVTTYLSIDDEEFFAVENQTLTTYANVSKLKVYFVADNPENVRTATLAVGNQTFDVSSAVSTATAFTVNITEHIDIDLTLIIQPGYTVNANAVLRRNTGAAGGLLFVSVNGGAFEQFADLSATDVGTSKTVTDELSEVYALAFYTTVNDDSLLTSATYDFGGAGEDFGTSTSPETATVLTISEETEINFDLLFRPFGYRVTLDQLTTGNTSSGISISVDGGAFTNYYGNQDNVLIEQYATEIDFYFIYDAATVDEKTAVYIDYVDDEQVEVNFVNSTHDNPVHIDLTADFNLIIDTYANIAPAGYTVNLIFDGFAVSATEYINFYYKINNQSNFISFEVGHDNEIYDDTHVLQNVSSLDFYMTPSYKWERFGQNGYPYPPTYQIDNENAVSFVVQSESSATNTVHLDLTKNITIKIRFVITD